jgi:hypothetical protein
VTGRESLRSSTAAEITGAWEILNDPIFCRYFIVTHDLRVGFLPGMEEFPDASGVSLSKMLDQKTAGWRKYAFSNGQMTTIAETVVEGYYSFRTATTAARVETFAGMVDLTPGDIIWAQLYRLPSPKPGARPFQVISPPVLRKHRLRRLPD